MSANPIPIKTDETFPFDAALYLLEEQGHYLLKYRSGEEYRTKYVKHGDVAAAFTGSEADTDWIDSGIVRLGSNKEGDWFVFYAPKQIRDIPFVIDGMAQVLRVPIPAMIMYALGGKISVYALKSKSFSPDSKLFLAPFPNTGDFGGVCWGSTPLPKITHTNARTIFDMFLSSTFNEHHDTGRIKGFEGSCLPYWKRLADRKAKTFPLRSLVPASYTVKGYLGRWI